jgi:hypothetical protein
MSRPRIDPEIRALVSANKPLESAVGRTTDPRSAYDTARRYIKSFQWTVTRRVFERGDIPLPRRR